MFSSSSRVKPDAAVPRHIAVIMDGNGRWARQRFLPRVAGHKRGVEAVRAIVRGCVERGVEYLTLFAFSSENWRRPPDEVSFLMQLFMRALRDEVSRLHENGIRLRIVGDLSRFEASLVQTIHEAEALTAGNSRLNLTIAANYGGRWDILQACAKLMQERGGVADPMPSEADIERHLAMSFAPAPDLFIRTGGEQRISNFLLWQLAYTELYFTDLLWPEFNDASLSDALASFAARERRFGRTSEQLQSGGTAADAIG